MKKIKIDKLTINKFGNIIKKYVEFIFTIVILVGISYVILSPLIGIVSNSLMTLSDAYNPLVFIIPTKLNFENYLIAYKLMEFSKSASFSILFSVFITLIQIFICSFVGYGFARFRFIGNNILFACVIITIVVPVQSMTIPLYTSMRYFDFLGFIKDPINLMNSFIPVVSMTFTGMGLRAGLYIYLFRQFFKGLPKEIEEAAFIDGAGGFKTYFTVMLPNAVSSIITVGVFSMVWQYNDTFYSSMFMNKFNFISLKIATIGSQYTQNFLSYDVNQTNIIINSGIVLAILPMIIMYLISQKYFMEGMERSGIVG